MAQKWADQCADVDYLVRVFLKIIIIFIVDYLVGAGSKLLSLAIIIINIDYLVRPPLELTLLTIIIIVG